MVMKATEDLEFFKELNKKNINLELIIHFQCCQQLKYEFFQRGATIIKQGDSPSKFYIILRGAVNVYIKKDDGDI